MSANIEPQAQITAKLLKLPSDQLGKTLALMWGFGCRECALAEPLMTGRGEDRRELRPHICPRYEEDSRKCTVFPTLSEQKKLADSVHINVEREFAKLLQVVDGQLNNALVRETMMYGSGGKSTFMWSEMKRKVLESIGKMHTDEKATEWQAKLDLAEVITLQDIRSELQKRNGVKILDAQPTRQDDSSPASVSQPASAGS